MDGRNLRILRASLGITQKELSNMTGIPVSRISRTETGKRQMTTDEEKMYLAVSDDQKTEPGNYLVYTDGGCSFNPGGYGGIGVVIINQDTGKETEISQGYTATTNNRMELRAALAALQQIPDGSMVKLYSDSKYLVNTMNGEWGKKTNHDLWEQILTAQRGKNVSYHWVRGHAGNDYNERCDCLATQGIRSETRIPDMGYIPDPVPVSNSNTPSRASGGAMAVQIRLPENIPSWEKKYPVNDSCAASIKKFLSGRKTFRDYMNLRTGGMDGWSRAGAEELMGMAGEELCLALREYFAYDKDLLTCLRWYGRGLSMEDSVRKTLVSMEVAENCIR